MRQVLYLDFQLKLLKSSVLKNWFGCCQINKSNLSRNSFFLTHAFSTSYTFNFMSFNTSRRQWKSRLLLIMLVSCYEVVFVSAGTCVELRQRHVYTETRFLVVSGKLFSMAVRLCTIRNRTIEYLLPKHTKPGPACRSTNDG